MLGFFKKKYHHHKSGRGKKLFKLIFVFFLIIGILGLLLYIPFRGMHVKAQVLLVSAKKVKESFKTNNLDEVEKNLAILKNDYASFQKESEKVYWATYLPVVGLYITDVKNGISAGEDILKAADITIQSMAPYADLIGFQKGASFAEKSADDRIETAVLTLDKILFRVDEIAKYIDSARAKLDRIDEGRYPNKIGDIEVGDKIKNVKEQFDGVASLFVDAKPLIKKFPEIMGAEKEKLYLVLFQNDKELRPTGGFLTAYALFKVNKGRFRVERSEDIYHLDQSISTHPKAPESILKYHKGVSQFNIRDSNLSPDLVESLKLFNSLYVKSGQKVNYDGVFFVDTHLLVDMLDVLGDTSASGIIFSSKRDPRCSCPQVIYKLLDEIDRPVNYVKENRKGLLGDLLYAIMQKALGFSPSKYWGKLSQVFIKNLEEKHILVNLKDESAQQAIEAINFGGRIKDFDGDYLHINDANLAGAKSNLFITHMITSDTEIKSDGTVERSITIDYKNPHKGSDCSLLRGGLCLNATFRNWLRIYVPKGSKLVSFKGSKTEVVTYEELGKTVYEGFMTVNPLGKSTVVVTYTLPFRVDKKSDYKLLIQKQPGTKGHLYKIVVDGHAINEFPLKEDKLIKLN